MYAVKQSAIGRQGMGFGALPLGLLLVALLMGNLPNPLERFFEIGPSMYRTLGQVVIRSESARLKSAIKSALDADGKLTQANMAGIWPVYMKDIPVGMALPVDGAGAIEVERERLIKLVAARPSRSVWTFWSPQ